MKKIYYLVLLLSLLSFNNLIAQNYVPFNNRLQSNLQVKGDIQLIGNGILNRQTNPITSNTPYLGSANNNDFNMQYIDIDNDATTFSSSSADLEIPSDCKRIVYAGLYWSAPYYFESSNPSVLAMHTDWNQIKFKVPGSNYIDLIADTDTDIQGEEDDIIYAADLGPFTAANYSVPYVCYKNVTSLLQSLVNANGTYVVANQRAMQGNASCGGWNLVVIYEDPFSTAKNFTIFDGLSEIRSGDAPLDIPVSGFTTIPVGPVKAKLGIASLEGDRSLTNDRLLINGNTMSTPTRSSSNFFNSTISNNGMPVNRMPNSSNTLGFDLDVFSIPNPSNSVIANNANNAIFRLETGGDTYDPYLFALAIDIIEPKIVITQSIEDIVGNDITNEDVTLCQDLVYVVAFQNQGTDDATNATIKKVLPLNITFNPNTDLILPLGVTLSSYTPETRTLLFNIDNSIITQNNTIQEIRINVKVKCTCLELDDSCSTEIKTKVFATYSGTINTNLFSDEDNLIAFGCNSTSSNAIVNSLVNLDSCNTTTVQYICDPAIILTAQDGYETYTWNSSTGGTITPVAGTMSQSVEISELGFYNVQNTITGGACRAINQTFEVRSCVPSNIVFRNGNRLAAAENNETYQWVDCDNNNEPITGATNQEFEATSPGNYAVIITNGIGNSVTSDCIAITVLNTELFDNKNVVLYPNPAKESFRIDTKFTLDKIIIYNLLGQKVKSYNGNKEEFSISELVSGTYMVEIVTDKGSVVSKIVKY